MFKLKTTLIFMVFFQVILQAAGNCYGEQNIQVGNLSSVTTSSRTVTEIRNEFAWYFILSRFPELFLQEVKGPITSLSRSELENVLQKVIAQLIENLGRYRLDHDFRLELVGCVIIGEAAYGSIAVNGELFFIRILQGEEWMQYVLNFSPQTRQQMNLLVEALRKNRLRNKALEVLSLMEPRPLRINPGFDFSWHDRDAIEAYLVTTLGTHLRKTEFLLHHFSFRASENVIFRGNNFAWELLLEELIRNAVEADPEGVKIKTRIKKNWYVVTIQNRIANGARFPVNAIDPFVSTKKHFGLGLTLARHVASISGWPLHIKQEKGIVTASLYIPVLKRNRNDSGFIGKELARVMEAVLKGDAGIEEAGDQLRGLWIESLFGIKKPQTLFQRIKDDFMGNPDEPLDVTMSLVNYYLDYRCGLLNSYESNLSGLFIMQLEFLYKQILLVEKNKYGFAIEKHRLDLLKQFYDLVEDIETTQKWRVKIKEKKVRRFMADLQDLKETVLMQMAYFAGRLNWHEEKREYYQRVLAINQNPLRYADDDMDIEYLGLIRQRLEAISDIFAQKQLGYSASDYLAGGIEFELEFFSHALGKRARLDFDELPVRLMVWLEERINAGIQRDWPNAPFHMHLDIDGMIELVSPLLLSDQKDSEKLPALLVDLQEAMLRKGLPLVYQALIEALQDNSNESVEIKERLKLHLVRELPRAIQMIFHSIHVNQSEPEEASDKNLQGLPGFFTLAFLDHFTPLNPDRRYWPVRGKDSFAVDKRDASTDNYRPGRNEIMMRYPWMNWTEPGSVVTFPVKNLSRFISTDLLKHLETELEKAMEDFEDFQESGEKVRAKITAYKKEGIDQSIESIDLRKTHLSAVLAILRWYQKSDMGEEHQYRNSHLPLIGYSLKEVHQVLMELQEKQLNLDAPLRTLAEKSFREILKVIVRDADFIYEYLAYFGSLEQYFYLAALAEKNGLTPTKVIGEEDPDITFLAGAQSAVESFSFDKYLVQDATNQGFSLKLVQKSPRFIKLKDHFSELPAYEEKGQTVTEVSFEAPAQFGLKPLIFFLKDVERIRRAQEILRNPSIVNTGQDILNYLEIEEDDLLFYATSDVAKVIIPSAFLASA